MYEITKNDIEGENYINVGTYSKLKVGKQLAPGYPTSFKSVLGTTGNIRNALNFLTIKGFPAKLIGKKRLTSYDIKSLQNKESVRISNYKAYLIYFISLRILDDHQLLKALAKLPIDIRFTSFNMRTDKILECKSRLYNDNISLYCDAIAELFMLIKNDKFTNYFIQKLILDSKSSEVDLFTDIPNPISIL